MSRSSTVQSSKLLQFALRADAIGCGLFALVLFDLLVFPNSLVDQLDIANSVLVAAGLVAALGAPLVWSMVRRERLTESSVWLLIACNFAWAIVSIVAVMSGWIQPTTLGTTLIVGQAIATGLIAELQFIGYRKSLDERNLAANTHAPAGSSR